MNAGDIVRVSAPGDHKGRYGVVREVFETPDRCIVEFEDDQKRVNFDWREVEFVRRGPVRTAPR
jgi:hypothetical protein